MVDDDTDLYPSSMGQDVIIENEYETGNLFLNFIPSSYILQITIVV